MLVQRSGGHLLETSLNHPEMGLDPQVITETPYFQQYIDLYQPGSSPLHSCGKLYPHPRRFQPRPVSKGNHLQLDDSPQSSSLQIF